VEKVIPPDYYDCEIIEVKLAPGRIDGQSNQEDYGYEVDPKIPTREKLVCEKNYLVG